MRNKNKKSEWCEFCDGKVGDRLVRARFHFKGQTMYVQNVPAWVCARCQEQYFDAAVYKRLEAIAARRGHIRKTVRFPLADYSLGLGLGF